MAHKDALDLYAALGRFPGLKVLGLHTYDGYVSEPDLEKRIAACEKAFALVLSLQKLLEKRGYRRVTLIAGDVPHFRSMRFG